MLLEYQLVPSNLGSLYPNRLDYVDHDNIIIIMADFAKYLSNTPVRKKNTNKEEYLSLETVKKYFGYVKVQLKELFPKLEA